MTAPNECKLATILLLFHLPISKRCCCTAKKCVGRWIGGVLSIDVLLYIIGESQKEGSN